ncbi:hypothetical protein L1987_48241 [Smallanthus sonchifolius]|uniref:Uncharacterized protein n=1 Tax=Smallanthus sonchifolius TaxID=185202 RepID=A0ACB9FSJ2_9ASTR|nr:hypothetical protein L1987_48241 [Smallanthus sonchifolius]
MPRSSIDVWTGAAYHRILISKELAMADNFISLEMEETLVMNWKNLQRLDAASARIERSFSEILATLRGLVERSDVLNNNKSNQEGRFNQLNGRINESNQEGSDQDNQEITVNKSNQSNQEAETSQLNEMGGFEFTTYQSKQSNQDVKTN